MKKFLLILFVLFLPSFSEAAITHVQSEMATIGNGSAASISLTLDTSVTSGNLLLVRGAFELTTATITVTGNSNTYVASPFTPLDSSTVVSTTFHYVLSANSGSTTVTYDPSSNTFMMMGVSEYSGHATTEQPHTYVKLTGTATTITTDTIRTGMNSLVAGIFGRGFDSAASITTGANYLQRFENENDGSDMGIHAQDRDDGGTIEVPAGAYTGAWTKAGSANWAVIVMSFREAGSNVPAAPMYKGSGALVNSATTCTCTMPAAPNAPIADDILLLVVQSENETIALTTANGFVQTADSPQGAGTPPATDPENNIAVYWKRAVGGDASPVVTDPGDHCTCAIHAFYGTIATGDPWDVTAGGNDSGANDTSANIPGDTTTVANTLVALIQGTSFNGTGTANCGAVTNADLTIITERFDSANTINLGGGHCLITGFRAATGTYATSTLTMANTTFKGALSIALKPAAIAAGGTTFPGWWGKQW